MLQLGCLYFFPLLLQQAIGPKLWSRREAALLLTTSLGIRKIAEEGEEKERERGRYIIIVSDVSHSNTAHIKVGKEGERRRRRQDAGAGRIILTFPFPCTMRLMSIPPYKTSIHISPFKFFCYCLLPKLFLKLFPQFWGVSDKCGRNRCRFHSRPLIMSTSFLPSLPSCASCKASSAFVGPFELGSRPPSLLSSFLFGLHWFLVRRRAGFALLCRLRGAGDESEALFVQDTQSRLS